MLLILDIDADTANLIDEINDDTAIAETLIDLTFGFVTAEIIRDAHGTIGVGVTLMSDVTIKDVQQQYKKSLTHLQSTLRQFSMSVFH